MEADPSAYDVTAAHSAVARKLIAFEGLREMSRYFYESAVQTSVVDVVASYPEGTPEKAALTAYMTRDYEGGAVNAEEYRDALVVQRPALQAALADYFSSNSVEVMVYPATLAAAAGLDAAAAGQAVIDGAAVDIAHAYGRNAALAAAVSGERREGEAPLLCHFLAAQMTSRTIG